MKKNIQNIVYATLICFLISACADENVVSLEDKMEEGKFVELNLSYHSILSTQVSARATEEEEKQLKDLQIFIFDANTKKLKGYKHVTDGLAQGGAIGNINIMTSTGESYIYGIANASTTIYEVEDFTSGWTEEDAQNKTIVFTLDELKTKIFTRKVEDEVNPSDGYFVMSGSMNEGQPCNILSGENKVAGIDVNGDGTMDNDKDVIKLRRVVAKIHFDFQAAGGRTFILKKYDICNIPTTGRILSSAETTESEKYLNKTKIIPSTQTPNQIDLYLPENIQSDNRKRNAAQWKERETNSYPNGNKSFDVAPENATYIIAYGQYSDGTNTANVEYTIHLGNFSKNVDNYDNERNCEYTYTITINGVDEIIAEARKDADTSQYNPGVEGFVLNSKAGKVYNLDSHYEACVVQFNKSDINALKEIGSGYMFQAQTYKGKSEVFTVKKEGVFVENEKWNDEKLKGVDYKWVEFALGGEYNSHNGKGGIPILYTSTNGKDLYDVVELLKYLYDDISWGNENTLTFTCFVKENYYDDDSWANYTNVEPRILYIANKVDRSEDKKSVYAEISYGIRQRAIQTFYNKEKAGSLIAYGCETIDESYTGEGYELIKGNDIGTFDGRLNMISLLNSLYSWDIDTEHRAVLECMNRNRDLDRNGEITADEVRWYLPTYAQYNGLWLGEEALADSEARLFQGSTINLPGNLMHYYGNTTGRQVFWSEEGSSFSTSKDDDDNAAKYIRCIRNLQSHATGVEKPKTALISASEEYNSKEYYSYNSSNRIFDMSNMDEKALRSYLQYNELGAHTEREELNKVRTKFRVAGKNLKLDKQSITLSQVIEGKIKCQGNYGEDGYSSGWRVPNQRELSLMVLENGNGINLTLKQNSNSEDGTFSKTQFSNIQYRYGFGYGGYEQGLEMFFRMYYYEKHKGQNGHIRCVRDIE